MKKRKHLLAFSLVTAMLLSLAACSSSGSSGKSGLPTLAPTYTPTPIPDSKDAPTPTPALDEGFTKIIELDGEDYNQTSHFAVRGIGSLSVKQVAHSGSFSFYVTGRDNPTDGFTLNFSDKDGAVTNVVGKKVHVAAWVYQETGAPQDFAFVLQVKKPDATTDNPLSISLPAVPSGEWALLEGDFEVYSNVTNPLVALEMSTSKDPFYFDDIRITYDPTSSVAANPVYSGNAFLGYYFDFEDQKEHFTTRGDSTPKIARGGMDDGSSCLFISERSQSWNGAQIDLTEHSLSDFPLWVSFAGMHKSDAKTKITCTLQTRAIGASADQYTTVVSTDSVLPDVWTEASAQIKIPSNCESVILYFETAGVEDFYIDNVLISTKNPEDADFSIGSDGKIDDTPVAEKIDTTGFVVIHDLTADVRKNESQILGGRGSATVEVSGRGYSGSSFEVANRTATWNGAGCDFTNLDNETFDVIGKEVFVSFYVYQDTGEPQEFSATLQVNKPNGDSAWPERVSVPAIPSGQWTYVEGIVPVYANVAVPQINFEMPTSENGSFRLDNIIISYNPNSSVDPNPEYIVREKVEFPGIFLDFENNDAFFQGRGSGKPSIVYGGHESSKCLAVTDRAGNWHGVQADFSDYILAGKTIEVSYWLYHEYTTPIEINMTAEQNDGVNTTYTPVLASGPINDGKWVKFTNTYTIPENMLKIVLYFESPSETAEFFVDDISIKLVE